MTYLMDIINSLILGVVEGITEFLPVSSTGHLIILNQYIKFNSSSEQFTRMFDVVIQFGAIISVLVFFRDRIFPFSGKMKHNERKNVYDIWIKACVGVVPAIFIGATLGEKIQERLFHPIYVSCMLLIGGIVLILIEARKKEAKVNTVRDINLITAFWIGLIQCLAMIPGTSRSAATIIGAMLMGLSRAAAVEYSFFLAIPTMASAGAYSFLKLGFNLTLFEWLILGTGFIVSFLTTWGVIAVFMNYILKHDFRFFGIYRIILGCVLLLLLYFGKI